MNSAPAQPSSLHTPPLKLSLYFSPLTPTNLVGLTSGDGASPALIFCFILGRYTPLRVVKVTQMLADISGVTSKCIFILS